MILKPGKIVKLADLFCGAGGTTTGATEAIRRLGFNVQVTAVNHWEVAVATHTANHPDARHLCASIDSTNPRELFGEGELDGLLASPECMSHSIARGDRPINDQSRSTAWCVLRWLDALRPPFILIENVPEFRRWGPIGSNGRPLKSREGEVFESWLNAIRALGYKVDHRIHCAADYGEPTTRRRLFIQAVRGRLSIVWPHATHAPVGKPTLFAARPWVAAERIIDWSQHGKSIFNRKTPLKPKTIARINEGLKRFCGLPFLMPKQMKRSGMEKPLSINLPVNTVIGDGRIHLVEPFLIAMEHGGRVLNRKKPLPTVTTAKGGAFGVAQPFLVQMNRGNGGDPKADGRRVRPVSAPLPTVCGNRGEWAICEAFLLPQGGGGAPRKTSEPVPTVHCDGAVAVVQPFMVPNFGERKGQKPRCRKVDDPLPAVTGQGAGALVQPFIVKYNGTGGALSCKEPLDTVSTKPRYGLAQPVFLIKGKKYKLDILYRMLQPKELAAAQGFPSTYQFTGTKTEVTKQIGNAVPRRLARALVAAIVTQNPDVSALVDDELEEREAVPA